MKKRRLPKLKPKEEIEYAPLPPGSEIKWSDITLNKGSRTVHPTGFTLMQVWVYSSAKPGELDVEFNRMARQKIGRRKYWSHGKLIMRFGASPDDMDAVEEYAAKFKLCVRRRDPGMQVMELWGRRSDFAKAFKIKWVKYPRRQDGPSGEPYGRIGNIWVPKHLIDIIQRVRDRNDPHLILTRVRARSAARAWSTKRLPTKIPRHLTNAKWTGKLLAQHYRFPEKWNGTTLDGQGQTIALIELGQGYLPSDVEKFFEELGIPTPTVVAATNDEGKNSWQSEGGEVITDIDVVGAVVPAARLVVYFGEQATADELLNVVSMAVFDRERKPSVISISWGWPEHLVMKHHQNLIDAMGDLFKKAALLGITICVATGDYGSLDMDPRSKDAHDALDSNEELQVDFPACLEASLACGGTWMSAGREQVWNEGKLFATGGGISKIVPRPVYQTKSHHYDKRGTPDVSGIAVHHAVIKQGKPMLLRGTSFVAPFWAGLIARLNQARGKRMGFINPVLYDHPNVCKSITQGHNDILRKQAPFYYEANNGWDAVTGLGVPNGPELLKVIMKEQS